MYVQNFAVEMLVSNAGLRIRNQELFCQFRILPSLRKVVSTSRYLCTYQGFIYVLVQDKSLLKTLKHSLENRVDVQ